MIKISYLNGEFLQNENCRISVEDRGYQFGDGVYEVILSVNNKLIDLLWHLERLMRSLSELDIKHSFKICDLSRVIQILFKKNNLASGSCYIQITRGVHSRIPQFPFEVEPNIYITIFPKKNISEEEFSRGFSVMTTEDIRWKRCDIKSTCLLASTMSNQKAKNLGFDDAIFVRDGFVTEATYANVFIVDENGELKTRHEDNLILSGITRKRIIDLATKSGIHVVERDIHVSEINKASEIFLTSSTLIIRPIYKIDGKIVGGKKQKNSFKMARKLKEIYENFIESC